VPATSEHRATGTIAAAAAGAIALWSTLAALGLALSHLPPFLLTGCALLIGAVPGLLHWRQWRVPQRTLLLGVGGLFGFHFLLFLALRFAPPVEANLVNYLWPLLIVVLTPVLLPGWPLTARHAVAAVLGFAGAALAIGIAPTAMSAQAALGFALAAGSATVWACYSLLSTALLLVVTGRPLTAALAAATLLIIGAALLAVTASGGSTAGSRR
jgi:drug/metabolite transporter (DMT)-like permease